jgi:CheY-like chemotaxis protein
MSIPKILVVDDDEVFRYTVKEFLERQKTPEGRSRYQVLGTDDRNEAQLLIERRQVTLALIDFYLTEDDDHDEGGLILARETKREFAVPRIIISRYERFTNVRKVLGRGQLALADDFISKHLELEEMKKIIEQHLLKARVFLCYAKPDLAPVTEIYNRLLQEGHLPWLDDKCLEAGQIWEVAIRSAISASDIFIVCWSRTLANWRGFARNEIQRALEIRREMLANDIYLIPARLEDCDIDSEELRQYQRVDLFDSDGFDRLFRAIKVAMNQRYGWT